jgi:hypothetical protein
MITEYLISRILQTHNANDESMSDTQSIVLLQRVRHLPAAQLLTAALKVDFVIPGSLR